MKIAMFTDSYMPQINGVVTSIEITKKALERKGHEVVVFAPKVPKYKDDDEGIYRLSSVSFLAHKEYRIGVPVEFLKDESLRNFDFDVMHVHTPFSVGGVALGITRKYYVPCVGTFHTLFSEYIHYFIKPQFIGGIKEIKFLFDRFSWRYLPWFYNHMDSVISPSERIKQLLEEKGVIKKIHVVPTGIRDAMISIKSKKSCRRKFGFGDKKIILHVGRISKEKNIAFIINSLMPMLARNEARLVITSDGPDKPAMERFAKKLGISGRILFTGYLGADDIADLYKASDLFVMASKSETQGIVLLEAAANGLPSVVLDSPVVSDFVKENGIGIVSDEKGFADSVKEMLPDSSYYSRKASLCSRKYKPEKFAGDLLKIYKNARKS